MSELLLSKNVYCKEEIDKSLNAFSKFGIFSVEDEKLYYKVNISDSVYDSELTMREFENYLIDLSVKDRKWL